MPPRDLLQVKMEEEHDETLKAMQALKERQKLRKVCKNSRARERYVMLGSILLRRRRKEKPSVRSVVKSWHTMVEHLTFMSTYVRFICSSILVLAAPVNSVQKKGPLRVFKKKFCSGTRSKEITEKIINMILTFTRPIPMVECDAFRVLICTLEPGYVMPRTKA